MTDQKTKIRPCKECGVDVEVHVYAADMHVKCEAHKGLSFSKRLRGRKSVLDPLAGGITPEERHQRLVGAVLVLRRTDGGVTWEETVSATGLKAFDEESGLLELWAVAGASLPKFDPNRECGQYMAVMRDEVLEVR